MVHLLLQVFVRVDNWFLLGVMEKFVRLRVVVTSGCEMVRAFELVTSHSSILLLAVYKSLNCGLKFKNVSDSYNWFVRFVGYLMK